ncbi:MAG: hypothetical protein WCK58_15680, partial [Chloroflexota bacterium]
MTWADAGTVQDPTAGVPRAAWVPVGLALVAEAAWIAVVAALLQAFVLRPPSLGIAGLLPVVGLGTFAAHRYGTRLGDRWGSVAITMAFACGLAGWLLDPAVRTILAEQGTGGIGAAIAVNPGGWMAWIAFVRGMAYARPPLDPARVGTMLGLGVPGLALAAMAGGMLAQPASSRFLDTAAVQVLVFLGAAIPAMTLARLGQVGRGAAVDWRRNPGWLAFVAALLLVTGLIALGIGSVAGHSIAMAASALVAPLLVVGFIAGFDRRSFQIVVLSVLIAAVLALGLSALGGGTSSTTGPSVVIPTNPTEPQATVPMALGALWIVLVAAVVAVLILARLWLRRRAVPLAADDEIRLIDHGGDQV